MNTTSQVAKPKFKVGDIVTSTLTGSTIHIMGINIYYTSHYDIIDNGLTCSNYIEYVDRVYVLNQDFINNKSFNNTLKDILK